MKRLLLCLVVVAGCSRHRDASSSSAAATSATGETKAAPPPLWLDNRLAGALPPPPAALQAAHAGEILDGRYKVCFAADGRVASVTPEQSIPGGDDAIEAALKAWRWFVVAPAGAAPVCQSTPIAWPMPQKSTIVRKADHPGVEAHGGDGAAPRLSPLYRALHAGEAVAATYKVCVDPDSGFVARVQPIVAAPGADAGLMDAVRTWKFDIVAGPSAKGPLCFGVPLRLDVGGPRHAPTEPLPPLPPPAAWPASALPVASASVIVRETRLSGDEPHLSTDTRGKLARTGGGHITLAYRVCVRPDGAVGLVEPVFGLPSDDEGVMAALRTARYKLDGPAGVGLCRVDALDFTVTTGL